MKRSVWLAALLALALCLTAASVSAAEATTVTLEADTAVADVALPAAGEAMILDLNGFTVTGQQTTLDLAGSLTIRDGSAGQTGKLSACRFVVQNGGELTLESGELTDNRTEEPGGAVRLNGGTFTMSGGTISGNECTSASQTASRGGAVYVAKGTFSMSGGSIADNSAISAGGVGVAVGTFTMSGGSITGNKAGVLDGEGALTGSASGIGGGGIGTWSDQSRVVVTGGDISDNVAHTQGGALKIYRGEAELSGVTVTGNKVAVAGTAYGGAFAVGGVGTDATEIAALHRLTIGQGCVVTGNGSDVKAGQYPTGLFLLGSVGFAGRGGEIVMNGGTVSGNSPEGTNGVFYLYGAAPGSMTMNGGVITGNTTRSGAVWICAGAEFTMNGGTISDNTATNTPGGGVFLYDADTVFRMTDGEISGNRAVTLPGGGVGVRGGTFTMDGGLITANSTENKQNGGGVSVQGNGAFIMNGGEIKANRASFNGGGVMVKENGVFTLNGGELSGNVAPGGTGAEVLVVGGSTEARLTMTGGVIGLAEDRDRSKLNFYSTSGTRARGELLGGEVRCALASTGEGANTTVDLAGVTLSGQLGTSGESRSNVVRIWSGHVYRIFSNHLGVTVHGGAFHDPVYLNEIGSGGEVAYSGEEGYAYRYAPVLKNEVTVTAAGRLIASMNGAAAAWTYPAGIETTALRVPASADFVIGERTVPGCAVALSGGRYTVSAPVTQADSGEQYRIVLRDGKGETIRALAGKLPQITGEGGAGGDLTGDGKVNGKDVTLLQRALAGGYGVALGNEADLTGDGKVNGKDVTLLQRALVGGYGVTLPGGVAVSGPADDNELNLLFIGNSYCYYWTDELYGMLSEAGYENVSVCNLYYSGCTLPQHWTWRVNDQSNYSFFIVDRDGRRETKNVSLAQCLALRDWDAVELLLGNGPMYNSGEEAARVNVRTYMPLLDAYLKEQAPRAGYYWLANWARELEYEDALETAEQQQAVADAFMAIGRDVQKQYGYTCAPCAAAWQLVRDDPLITAGGRNLTTRIYNGQAQYDDYTHDGDVGGGQYLNACVWFETITRTSCVGSAYRPSYVFQGTDYSLSEAQIALLQNAAHQAVADFHGADWAK